MLYYYLYKSGSTESPTCTSRMV